MNRALVTAIVLAPVIALAQPAPPTPPPAPAPQPTPPSPPTPQPTPPSSDQPAEPAQPAPPPEPEKHLEPIKPVEPAKPKEPPTVVLPAKPVVTAEEDAPPKLSMPSEADRAAWTRPGFRLELGLAYGRMVGVRGAPSGRLLGPLLRAGLRLDKDWSILTSFQYESARGSNGGLQGLRFGGTIDPTWHVTRELALGVGFGFGGIVEQGGARMDATPLPDTLESPYTFPDASHPIASCSGVGAVGLVRGDYGYVVGPRGTLMVSLEVLGQWTGCTDDTGQRVEPDTGKAIDRHQWWPHVGGTLAVGFMWR